MTDGHAVNSRSCCSILVPVCLAIWIVGCDGSSAEDRGRDFLPDYDAGSGGNPVGDRDGDIGADDTGADDTGTDDTGADDDGAVGGDTSVPGWTDPCGNGVIDDGEECDDGDENDSDDCLSTCVAATCGDGIVRLGHEACDDGNDVQTDGCLNSCVEATCGDGIVREGVEGCDDGNDVDTDECSNACAPDTCGDGVVQPETEGCDDGNDVDTDECLNSCVEATCGDGVVRDGMEACDDGNDVDTDACLSTCVEAECGDGVVQDGVEGCDDGNDVDTDDCLSTCVEAECGDGVVQDGVEACDDGNRVNTDECLNRCVEAECGDGVVQRGVEGCDDGNDVDTDDCLSSCEEAHCGDGFLLDNSDEECDDGDENGAPVLGACSDECTETNHFVHVMTMAADGSVTSGSWDDALERVSEDLEDCILRFDNRIARPFYVEYSIDSLRFDFQPLHASGGTGQSEAYAFVSLEPDGRAGVGATYRSSTAEDQHRYPLVSERSGAQFPEIFWQAMEVNLYCPKENPYEHVASFDANGRTTSGSWHELHAMVSERAALCKVRFGGRVVPVHHAEFETNSINFDFLGLHASQLGYDAYAYANITRNARAGVGTSYRRGADYYISMRDRAQYQEMHWQGRGIDVFCADVYSDEFEVFPSGTGGNPVWDEMLEAVVEEGRDCRVRYDNRVSTPEHIEYGSGMVTFEFDNLHAVAGRAEAFGALRVAQTFGAQLGGGYRYGTIMYPVPYWRTSMSDAPFRPNTRLRLFDVTVRCRESSDYRRVLALTSRGGEAFSSWSDFYEGMADPEQVYECKLRLNNTTRIAQPVLVEYGNGSQETMNFDFHSLAAPANQWEAYATIVASPGSRTGMTSSRRRGVPAFVWQQDRMQSGLMHPPIPDEVDFLCH